MASPSLGGEGDGARGGGHEDKHAGGVGAPLRIDISVKEQSDGKGNANENDDQRARRTCPLRRHSEVGQIAGNKVEQTGHRGGAGKRQDENRTHVVNGAEDIAQVVMGEEGHRPAICRPSFLEIGSWNEQRGHKARRHQEDAHNDGCGREQAPGIEDSFLDVFRLDERHDRDARLEA